MSGRNWDRLRCRRGRSYDQRRLAPTDGHFASYLRRGLIGEQVWINGAHRPRPIIGGERPARLRNRRLEELSSYGDAGGLPGDIGKSFVGGDSTTEGAGSADA